MTISTEHLAELLAGIARSQQALIDAIERADGGWRNTHLIPLLTVAASMRLAEPRLMDLPSRILLRFQGRTPVDGASIVADLERLLALPAQSPAAAEASAATAPGSSTPLAARMAAASAPQAVARPVAAPAAAPVQRPAPAAAPVQAPTAAPRPAPAAGGENLDFSKP